MLRFEAPGHPDFPGEAYLGVPGQVCAGGEGVYFIDGRCVPSGIVDPPLQGLLDGVIPAVAILILIGLIASSIRQRRMSWWLMISLAAASTFWLETFGDWGQHLLYSPNFTHYSVNLPMTAPHNPAWMPFMYAVYWVLHTWAILRLAQWFQKRRPGMSIGRAIIVFSVPLTFVWNIFVEGCAAYMGWWTYDPPIGPYLDMGRGNFPLLWPMLLMFTWPNLIAWLVGLPEEEQRLNRLERWFGFEKRLRARVGDQAALDPGAGGWGLQLQRMMIWIAVFQITFILCFIIPDAGLRIVTGWDSFYLP